MLGSVVLDVAIGMSFVYLLLSLIASVVQEIISTFLQLRAANLERGIRSLVSGDSIWGKDLVDAIYDHGLVRGLYSDPQKDSGKKTGSVKLLGNAIRKVLRFLIGIEPDKPVTVVSDPMLLPAYIPARTFALAVIDILNRNKATGDETMKQIANSLAEHYWKYEENKAGEALFSLAVSAKLDLESFQTHLESWYNDGMDRASGWYKRYTQKILLCIGIILAVTFNVDSIRVARALYTDRDVRQAMVSAASSYSATTVNTDPSTSPDSKEVGDLALYNKLTNSAKAFDSVANAALLPVGWKSGFFKLPDGNMEKVYLFIGWLLTGAALSLGAPFWFDLLNKFMVVRSTIKPQEKSKDEGSKD
ncbi:hypothetical protein [Granulicella sibirica]|uniref:Uncharacterized protein n=1 Tax=Granulicella sibirica TaxID=2479048 RepID=A0A4Q0T340_9BACT|nr:hypothetical protein [Granulicella sibirica]RXH56880.1 hypothetical protein GRAN_0190 [Granulicella sibirica]